MLHGIVPGVDVCTRLIHWKIRMRMNQFKQWTISEVIRCALAEASELESINSIAIVAFLDCNMIMHSIDHNIFNQYGWLKPSPRIDGLTKFYSFELKLLSDRH